MYLSEYATRQKLCQVILIASIAFRGKANVICPGLDPSGLGRSPFAPFQDVVTVPQSYASVALVDRGLREVGIAMKICGDAVVMLEPDKPCHFTCADQVINVHGASHTVQSRKVDAEVGNCRIGL